MAPTYETTTKFDLTRISSKGQITIPTGIRRAFKIKTGQTFTVQARKDGILIKPVDVAITDKTAAPDWGAGLRAALEDLKAGRTRKFKNEREFFEHVDRLSDQKTSKERSSRQRTS